LENNLQKQQQEKGENMKKLVGNYSTFNRNSRNPLDLFMSTLSLPVGVAAEGLGRVLNGLQTGSEASGLLAGAGLAGGTSKMFEALKDNPLGGMRKAEIEELKTKLKANQEYFDDLLNELSNSGREGIPTFNKDRFDQLKAEIMQQNPSSSLLKAMKKIEKMITTLNDSQQRVNTKSEQTQKQSFDLAIQRLALEITDELGRIEKLVGTSEVNQPTGIFAKLAGELKTWFKDIMLSFRESKLQGLKHLALGFGEVLLGIGAVVATFALAALMLPVLVASIGVNLATRAANVVAGVCLHVFSRVYNLTASIFSKGFLSRKEVNGKSQQQIFDDRTEEMTKKLEEKASELFAQAKKFDNPKETVQKVAKFFTKSPASVQSSSKSEYADGAGPSPQDAEGTRVVQGRIDRLADTASGQGPESILRAGLNLSRSEGDV
jgi:hypothetical protein